MLTFDELVLTCEKYPGKSDKEAYFEWLSWLHVSFLDGEFNSGGISLEDGVADALAAVVGELDSDDPRIKLEVDCESVMLNSRENE